MNRKTDDGWAVLTSELEDIFQSWVIRNGLEEYMMIHGFANMGNYGRTPALGEGNRRVVPQGHGPDADEVNEDEYY